MSDETQEPRWIAQKQAEVATFFRVSNDTVAMWARKGMPGARKRYPLDEILAWLRKDGPWQQKQKNDTEDRLQAIKLELAELELLEKKGSLVSVGEASEVFARCGHRIRSAIEGLQSNHAALTRLLEALDDCKRMIGEMGE